MVWSKMQSNTISRRIGVWGASGSDAFSVGSYGIIVQYNGSTWEKMASGTETELHHAWGTSGSDVFAVGHDGVILHYDGSSWSLMLSPTANYLEGVWGTASDNVFSVGWQGTILYYGESLPISTIPASTTAVSSSTTTVSPVTTTGPSSTSTGLYTTSSISTNSTTTSSGGNGGKTTTTSISGGGTTTVPATSTTTVQIVTTTTSVPVPCVNPNDCDDGLFCTGVEQCVDGFCVAGQLPCSAAQICKEEIDECWDVVTIPVLCLKKRVWVPIFLEKKNVWLIVYSQDTNNFSAGQSSIVLTGEEAGFHGIIVNPNRKVFKFFNFIYVPVQIEKGATKGQWKLQIKTDVTGGDKPYQEVMETSFLVK
jgi:hypothetical protein